MLPEPYFNLSITHRALLEYPLIVQMYSAARYPSSKEKLIQFTDLSSVIVNVIVTQNTNLLNSMLLPNEADRNVVVRASKVQ